MIALSWSRLSDYMQCPLKFHLKYISKSFPKVDETSIHLVKGKMLHKQMEDFVNAKNGLATMPLGFSPEVQQTIPYVEKLYNIYGNVYPEAQVACTKDWETCDWFGNAVGWRAIWDVIALNPKLTFIGDYKSGKVYDYSSTFGQLHLSALMALKRFEAAEEVSTAYIYMEHKKILPIKVTREPTDQVDSSGKPIAHMAQVQGYFDEQFEKVQMETAWEPTPNEFCKWCEATKAQCKFSRRL